ncbi:MAG: lipoate--protein ligase family protein [Deltaproteobacteria bacterium]|nr:lipoate--protein ligase family protein [Deltaproteobacteria bacterium]
MKFIDRTLLLPEHNLACDEALLEMCERGHEDEILRFWESPIHFAVIGYSGRINEEVNLDRCKAENIPVLRRCSGGGAVLQGPGCLNYSLVLKISDSGPSRNISETNESIMARHKATLERGLRTTVSIQGVTDLALGTRKFSGNAQYRRRHCLLYHGTFLLDFDVSSMEKFLPVPGKQPPYREMRSHSDFLINLRIPSSTIKEALKKTWNAADPLEDLPETIIDELVNERYGRAEWNFKF